MPCWIPNHSLPLLMCSLLQFLSCLPPLLIQPVFKPLAIPTDPACYQAVHLPLLSGARPPVITTPAQALPDPGIVSTNPRPDLPDHQLAIFSDAQLDLQL
ncbi:Hypothetical predicted protein [Scomber scombrus]|uniref:Secreted protein n=1 Tax=Scomber scombrus TaxID=13677 RepID=A0AAV1P0R2_SCOSC